MNTATVLARIQELGAISEDSACLTRTFGSGAMVKASQLIAGWMQEAGLLTRIDNIHNVRGRRVSKNPAARTLVLGSHYDTVVNAGKFDGPLGILMALEVVSAINIELPFHIEVVAFSDEEGVRYHTTYLGSKVLTGAFDPSLLSLKDAAGITLGDAIQLMGGCTEQLLHDKIPADQWLGYFEIHIEQGPVLYEKHIPLAIVTAIAGQQRSQLIVKGMAGHAGTVPMEMRQDALCCASECILIIEQWAVQHRDQVLATVGTLQVVHGASNVIPGEVVCSLDLRSADPDMLRKTHVELAAQLADVCEKRKISFEWHVVQETAPVICDPELSTLLERSIPAAERVKLVSGAGHDAVAVSAIAPVCMLFVRCFKGISHHPQEDVEAADIEVALEVARSFILQLI
ncbi:M20 family metallo-hydrolase [Chitinophaga sancti]|uniref:Allantoate deiminase n=1 Tax=Chitinophaga sancti TaxID=1004 RepID=A0A1K1SRH1_9BACT|nr:M20 family metallo-hydrolase [Chitinophaga sancti]WQD65317.1 M20 family metallo-hydrolase [Chitinophaga sancti]WQG89059.1 M20 family metallo-hydrolase [Chitinophaga sancti]SFW86913.1 allantoate deiminase [Chitinophaga sancti]